MLVTDLADRSLPGAMDAKMRRTPCRETRPVDERRRLAGIAVFDGRARNRAGQLECPGRSRPLTRAAGGRAWPTVSGTGCVARWRRVGYGLAAGSRRTSWSRSSRRERSSASGQPAGIAAPSRLAAWLRRPLSRQAIVACESTTRSTRAARMRAIGSSGLARSQPWRMRTVVLMRLFCVVDVLDAGFVESGAASPGKRAFARPRRVLARVVQGCATNVVGSARQGNRSAASARTQRSASTPAAAPRRVADRRRPDCRPLFEGLDFVEVAVMSPCMDPGVRFSGVECPRTRSLRTGARACAR